MKKLIVLFCVFNTFSLYGQYLLPEKLNECKIGAFDLESDTILANYKTIDSLAHDIYLGLNNQYTNKLRGKIVIQVYVDTLGHSCCISIMNDCNVKSSKLGIIKSINSLDKWTIPKRFRKRFNVCALIRITFNESDIVLERIGFNYYTKFKTLDKVTLKKKTTGANNGGCCTTKKKERFD